MKKTLIILGIICLVIFVGFVGLKWLGGNLAGGGGITQIVPDTVKSGDPAVVDLKLTVWGGGGPIKGRYTDIFLNYQITGQDVLGQLKPKLISQDEKSETYEFIIPGFPKGTKGGEIQYSIEAKLDGQPSRIEGIKKIQII